MTVFSISKYNEAPKLNTSENRESHDHSKHLTLHGKNKSKTKLKVIVATPAEWQSTQNARV